MKTILVSTDFSAAAENATLYAGHLAKSLGSSLLMINAYQLPVTMNEMPVMVLSADELREGAEKSMERARESVLKSFPGLSVHSETRLGDLAGELEEISASRDPLMIVMGKHVASGVERILFGSNATSVVRHSKHPVLVVPDSVRPATPRQAAVAIDRESVHRLEEVQDLITRLGAGLHVMHVEVEGSGSAIREMGIPCDIIRDDEFIHGIESYLREKNIELLVIFPHRHSALERFFLRTHTSELMKKIQIPILCINEH